MVKTPIQNLFEPYPQLLRPEPWWLYEKMGREILRSWDRVAADILQYDNAEVLHESRDEYERILLAHLKIIEGYLTLLYSSREFNGNQQHIVEIERTRDELTSHYSKLFPRWQTLDDLEGILIERLPRLDHTKMKALAAKYPPPQSWYDEDWEALP